MLKELADTKKKLDIARHTIGWINQMIDEHADKQAIKIKCEYALEQINQKEESTNSTTQKQMLDSLSMEL